MKTLDPTQLPASIPTLSTDQVADHAAIEPHEVTAIGTPPKPTSRAKVLLPLLIGLALAAGGVTFAMGQGKETTDDAQVEGHVANVSPRVAGQVTRVLVKDNQRVNAGDVLVELDARDYAAKLSAAKADLAASIAALRTAETQLVVTEKSASSNLVVAKGGLSQAAALGATTRASIEQARADILAIAARISSRSASSRRRSTTRAKPRSIRATQPSRKPSRDWSARRPTSGARPARSKKRAATFSPQS
jgi:membrane fusion protein (multidrug efflux system)